VNSLPVWKKDRYRPSQRTSCSGRHRVITVAVKAGSQQAAKYGSLVPASSDDYGTLVMLLKAASVRTYCLNQRRLRASGSDDLDETIDGELLHNIYLTTCTVALKSLCSEKHHG
jgi:hypothetical protein